MTRMYSLILSAALLGAAPAVAQVPLGGIVTGNDVDRIVEILGAYGTAERRQGEHSPWIRVETDGIVSSVTFLNCDDAGGNCTTVQFRAWWESNGAHSLEAMNQWNRDRRFSAAYLDADMDATIEWDVNLAGGVTAVNFDDDVQWWLSVVRQFREQVIQPGYDEAAPQGSK